MFGCETPYSRNWDAAGGAPADRAEVRALIMALGRSDPIGVNEVGIDEGNHNLETVIRAFLAALVFATSVLAAETAASWRAGVASLVITPKSNMWMAGCASRDHPSTGTVQDLMAKALAIADDKRGDDSFSSPWTSSGFRRA